MKERDGYGTTDPGDECLRIDAHCDKCSGARPFTSCGCGCHDTYGSDVPARCDWITVGNPLTLCGAALPCPLHACKCVECLPERLATGDVCAHGYLARTCEICELTSALVAAESDNSLLRLRMSTDVEMLAAAEARITERDEWLRNTNDAADTEASTYLREIRGLEQRIAAAEARIAAVREVIKEMAHHRFGDDCEGCLEDFMIEARHALEGDK